MDSQAVISSLPLSGADRAALIEVANAAFEAVIERIEPNNEKLTRSLWDAGDYIDNCVVPDFLSPDKLPMPRDEVAYLIDAFLVHHVISLAVAADRQAAEPVH
ncbi:conserved hypothetical protein [Mesorhizobium plurifarium]|uniref:Uncharacterized protein n=1 Tax=Mesorhizobium plurifarium TaxID=69974 RepID=A0A090E3E6_MESPL|nr:conserved hypothetical protein [Mesorhizobium plurifarium]